MLIISKLYILFLKLNIFLNKKLKLKFLKTQCLNVFEVEVYLLPSGAYNVP